jgi:hyperosmotically inducible periplasmic protein
MTRISLAVLSFLFLATSCDTPSDVKSDEPAIKTEASKPDANVAPDNTKVNERDQDAATLTPGDQSENPMDVGMTQRIRQAIVDDSSLTMGEKNVKIITIDGVVTLRGPVETEASKAKIATIAQNTSGVKKVDNQLETASAANSNEINTTK